MRGLSTIARTNSNEVITTNLTDYHSLYDGMYVQSYGNEDTIYKVFFDNTKLNFVRASHKIVDGNLEEVPDSIGVINQIAGRGNWCETIYTDRLNLIRIRANKLEELGI